MPQAEIIRDTNSVYLVGNVAIAPKFTYKQGKRDIFEGRIDVPRLSGVIDHIPLVTDCANASEISAGDYISIKGRLQRRGKVKYPNVADRLIVFANECCPAPHSAEPANHVALSGHLCKEPVFRVTPFGRYICDLLIAVANGNGSQEYCFCVAWGHTAQIASLLDVGAALSVEGRFQSRDYIKRFADGTESQKTTHEISISSIE